MAGATQPGSVADLIVHGCRLSCVSRLLEQARKRKRNQDGETQLLRAIEYNKIELVRRLFSLGCRDALVNAQNCGGLTALFCASARDCDAIVRELLAHHADVNIKSKSGCTPLMLASFHGHLNIARLLCDAPGIDFAVRDRQSRLTALGWALRGNHAEFADLLRSRARPNVLT